MAAAGAMESAAASSAAAAAPGPASSQLPEQAAAGLATLLGCRGPEGARGSPLLAASGSRRGHPRRGCALERTGAVAVAGGVAPGGRRRRLAASGCAAAAAVVAVLSLVAACASAFSAAAAAAASATPRGVIPRRPQHGLLRRSRQQRGLAAPGRAAVESGGGSGVGGDLVPAQRGEVVKATAEDGAAAGAEQRESPGAKRLGGKTSVSGRRTPPPPPPPQPEPYRNSEPVAEEDSNVLLKVLALLAALALGRSLLFSNLQEEQDTYYFSSRSFVAVTTYDENGQLNTNVREDSSVRTNIPGLQQQQQQRQQQRALPLATPLLPGFDF